MWTSLCLAAEMKKSCFCNYHLFRIIDHRGKGTLKIPLYAEMSFAAYFLKLKCIPLVEHQVTLDGTSMNVFKLFKCLFKMLEVF